MDDGTVTQFLGVPFAAPPVGPLRWAPPQPPTPWVSPRNASWWGPACPQDPEFAIFGLFSGMSAVLVWFYPGGYIFGTGGFVGWDGAFPIAGLGLNVSIVKVAYRVNSFGFLGGADLLQNGTTGNWGTADQRFALSFLAANARAFRLDPSRVTIWGVSAGGASVSHLLANPRAWGTFSRAVVESGAMGEWISFSMEAAQAQFDAFAAAANCTGAGAAACLRALPWEALVAVSTLDFLSLERWGPVVDGAEVPDWPRNMAASGNLAPGVPLLIGSNRDEGTMFAVPDDLDMGMNETGWLAALSRTFGADKVAALAALYPPAAFEGPMCVDGVSSHWQSFARAVGDFMITCPSRDQARWFASPNRTNPAPVFVWHLEHQVEMFRELAPWAGVMHGSDVPFVLDFQPWATWGFGEAALADAMVGLLARFAAAGDPRGGGVSAWPAYTAAGDESLLVNTGAGGPNLTVAVGVRRAECDFWAANQPVHPKPPAP